MFHFDRRGRGESGDAGPLHRQGNRRYRRAHRGFRRFGERLWPFLRGGSGRACGIRRARRSRSLVLHEPPYGPDDAESRAGNKAFAISITRLIHAGRHAEAVETFMGSAGVPPEMIQADARRPPDCADGAHDAPRHRGHGRDPIRRFDAGRHHQDHCTADPRLSGGPVRSSSGTRRSDWPALLPRAELQILQDQDHGAEPAVVASNETIRRASTPVRLVKRACFEDVRWPGWSNFEYSVTGADGPQGPMSLHAAREGRRSALLEGRMACRFGQPRCTRKRPERVRAPPWFCAGIRVRKIKGETCGGRR